MSYDYEELSNALSMLPFAYLSIFPVNMALKISMFVMWSSSFMYHLYLYKSKMLYDLLVIQQHKNTASTYFTIDCISQITTILFLCDSCAMFPVFIKVLYKLNGIITIQCILSIYFSQYPLHAILKNKMVIHTRLICIHIWHVICSTIYAKYRVNAIKSLLSLCGVGIMFVTHEVYGVKYTWSIGHGFCFLYTLFSWKALGIIES
jgi:hypothetical protein